MGEYNVLNHGNIGKHVPIVCIHGWGGSLDSLAKLQKIISSKLPNPIFNIELPGFGNTPLKKDAMVLDDYAKFVKDFCINQGLDRVILVGHSFGGKISLKICIEGYLRVEKLILINSSGIRPRYTLKQKALRLISGVLGNRIKENFPFKKYFYYYLLGERDYYNARSGLKATLSNVVEEHLDDDLGRVQVQTLLIWGELDTYVPLWMGEKLAQRIPKAQFVKIDGGKHSLPITSPEIVAINICKFL